MKDILIADVEVDNGFYPSEIYLIGISDYYTGEYVCYHGEDIPDGMVRLMDAGMIIGYNFKMHAARHLRELTGNACNIPKQRVIDTVNLSQKFFSLPKHDPKMWGEILEYPMLPNDTFSGYSTRFDHYCERKLQIIKRTFDFIHSQNVGYVNDMMKKCLTY